MLRRLSFTPPKNILASRGSPKNAGKVILGEGVSTADQDYENLFDGARIKAPDGKFYAVQEKIGEGSCGKVYRARDETSEKDIVIKFTSNINNDHTQAQNEAKMHELMGTLISPAFEYQYSGALGTLSFFVTPMQYIDGQTLSDYLHDTPDRSLDHCYKLAIKLCFLIEKLHRCNITHGDIKPNNIMIDKHGNLHLIDFDRAEVNDFTGDQYESTSIYQLPGSIEITRPVKDWIALRRCIYMDDCFITALSGDKCIYSMQAEDQAVFKSKNHEINSHVNEKIRPLLSTKFLGDNNCQLPMEEIYEKLPMDDCLSLVQNLAKTSPRPTRTLTLAALEYEKLRLTDKRSEAFVYANTIHAECYREDNYNDAGALAHALQKMSYPTDNPFFKAIYELASMKTSSPINQNAFYGEASSSAQATSETGQPQGNSPTAHKK